MGESEASSGRISHKRGFVGKGIFRPMMAETAIMYCVPGISVSPEFPRNFPDEALERFLQTDPHELQRRPDKKKPPPKRGQGVQGRSRPKSDD